MRLRLWRFLTAVKGVATCGLRVARGASADQAAAHGLFVTHKDQLNADLFAFVKS